MITICSTTYCKHNEINLIKTISFGVIFNILDLDILYRVAFRCVAQPDQLGTRSVRRASGARVRNRPRTGVGRRPR